MSERQIDDSPTLVRDFYHVQYENKTTKDWWIYDGSDTLEGAQHKLKQARAQDPQLTWRIVREHVTREFYEVIEP